MIPELAAPATAILLEPGLLAGEAQILERRITLFPFDREPLFADGPAVEKADTPSRNSFVDEPGSVGQMRRIHDVRAVLRFPE